MEVYNIGDFWRGWIIGDFEPSLLRTKDFEVGMVTHKKGENWPRHVHREADEYNLLVSGKMEINGTSLSTGAVFVIEKNEVSKPEFLEDCKVVVIKVPSVIGDKHEVI